MHAFTSQRLLSSPSQWSISSYTSPPQFMTSFPSDTINPENLPTENTSGSPFGLSSPSSAGSIAYSSTTANSTTQADTQGSHDCYHVLSVEVFGIFHFLLSTGCTSSRTPPDQGGVWNPGCLAGRRFVREEEKRSMRWAVRLTLNECHRNWEVLQAVAPDWTEFCGRFRFRHSCYVHDM
jgi:hypothetical protein